MHFYESAENVSICEMSGEYSQLVTRSTRLQQMSESDNDRATKLLISLKHLTYKERLEQLKLPTLKYRRARGDMIEVYKIIVWIK